LLLSNGGSRPRTEPAVLPSLTQTSTREHVVLTLVGDFDIQTRGELVSACRRLERRAAAHRIHVDLSRVGFIDCGSLGVIAGLVRTRRSMGDPATVVVTSPFLHQLLEMLDFADPEVIVGQLYDVA
jgi:anti-anti-sigma factor